MTSRLSTPFLPRRSRDLGGKSTRYGAGIPALESGCAPAPAQWFSQQFGFIKHLYHALCPVLGMDMKMRKMVSPLGILQPTRGNRFLIETKRIFSIVFPFLEQKKFPPCLGCQELWRTGPSRSACANAIWVPWHLRDHLMEQPQALGTRFEWLCSLHKREQKCTLPSKQ